MPENDLLIRKLAQRLRRWPKKASDMDVYLLADEVLRLTPKKVGKPSIVKAPLEIAGVQYELRLTAQERA